MTRYARRLPVVIAMLAASLAVTSAFAAQGESVASTPIQIGIDRSNMSTEWTLSQPAEPDRYPFNGSYNGTGVFEARRLAVFDGIARLHPAWFRDGFGADTAADAKMFVDTVAQVHARGMKLLAVVGTTNSDYDPRDVILGNPKVNGCQWSTAPLSRIDLQHFGHRLRTHFDALKASGASVDAFEIGNELDLYCNDADMPITSEFAAHGWKWFLTSEQIHTFASGYVPFLSAATRLIKQYFPQAKIITFGMSNPTGNSAALIAALEHFTDRSGKTFDYTTLVDGYGTHIYPPSTTTLHAVQSSTANLAAQAAMLPHAETKPLWITEWNEAASALWSSKHWYFRYDASGRPGGDLNLAAKPYPAMDRAGVIHAFEAALAELRSRPVPVRVDYLFYYEYDADAKTTMCDDTAFNKSHGIVGSCPSGVIDPSDGSLLPDVAAAVMNRTP